MIKAYFKSSEHMTEVSDETVQLAISALPSSEPFLYSARKGVPRDQAIKGVRYGYPNLGVFLFTNVPPIRNFYRLNIKEIERALKPNGVFILNIGNPTITIENNVFEAALKILYPYIIAEDMIFRLSNLTLQREHLSVVNYRHLLGGDKQHIERWFIFSKTSTWKEKKTKTPLILKGNIIPLEAGAETPFAEDIIEFFIKKFTDEHDWVLDAYAGLGTLGIVASRLNRNAILYENNPKPWKTLCERVAKVQNVD